MKLLAVAILRQSPDAGKPVVLGSGMELSSFGYFQRRHIREMFTFMVRTIVQRAELGSRQAVQEAGYVCCVHVRSNGLAGVVVCDQEYPTTSSFLVISRVLDDFLGAVEPDSWLQTTQDLTLADRLLGEAVVKYQDHTQIDRIAKMQRTLDETKVILYQSIQALLRRGETLEALVDKSEDLSLASQVFAKKAKKLNSCCS